MHKQWNEEDHPRDDIGRFTFKGAGSSSSTKENGKYMENNIKLPNIDWGNLKNILLNVLGKYVTPAVALYASIYQLRKMIKEHNLEDKLDKAIEANSKNNGNKKEQENSQDNNEDSSNSNSKEYRNKLLNALGDKASKADILYATPKQHEEKIGEYGLDKKSNTGRESFNNAEFSDDVIKKAREFIQGSEGFRANAYKPTPNDVWTIGFGHTEGVKWYC